VTSRLLSPVQALEKVRAAMSSEILGPIIRVVGIAGPGDPLANDETFETFRMVAGEFPHLIKCTSTNGLLLPETIERLDSLGLQSLTVTLNTLDSAIGARIYKHIRYRGRRYTGEEAARLLIANQLEGIRMAAGFGMTVKVNTVLIPGLNRDQIPLIARKVKDLGAAVMNVMPLIPQADFSNVEPPSPEELAAVQAANERIIDQFRHCRQCRADAVGLVGQ
jgi:nitrogen fixation protein NifB